MKTNTEPIIEEALMMFQKYFIDLVKVTLEYDELGKHGSPPGSLIFAYHDKYSKKGPGIGNIIKKWRISTTTISEISVNIEPEHQPQDGMYYNEGHGFFAFDKSIKNLILWWQVGPRYGQGYNYKVKDVNNQVVIDEPYLLWMS
jgi:hypothetical protein